MGKKKHKKKQKKADAAAAEQAATQQPSPLHRVGQALLDQARSPAGRQLIATGLVAAATALAREANRAGKPAADAAVPASEPTPPPATPPIRPDVTAFAGLALSALDQFIQRKTPNDKT